MEKTYTLRYTLPFVSGNSTYEVHGITRYTLNKVRGISVYYPESSTCRAEHWTLPVMPSHIEMVLE